jgi:hypothetical protein
MLTRLVPGFDARRWKVVRHLENSADAPDFAELVMTERSALEFYQSYQGSDIFGGCEGIFSFVGMPSSRALFFGAYLVRGNAQVVRLDPGDPAVPSSLRPLWRRWSSAEKDEFKYRMERDARFAPLEGRVVIDWGKGALAWHQKNSDKPVVEVREANQIGPCPSFPEIDVSLLKIAFLAKNESANASWVTKLGSVGGIYLLTDHRNDRLYVGQAGGEGKDGGFWARWKAYAAGSSGNKLVDEAVRAGTIRAEDPDVSMSILEVVPLGKANKSRLDDLENRWKVRLRSRFSKHGLNDN